jgi:hypothetical protein
MLPQSLGFVATHLKKKNFKNLMKQTVIHAGLSP